MEELLLEIKAYGPKFETDSEVFEFVLDVMQKGAIGLNRARNAWQHSHSVTIMKGFRAIVHENASVKEAESICETEKKAG